ncbi:CRISPR-associated protein Cas4 [Anaerovorax odorimutans]|uniref:CRISPR-associated exonuclease Cas4 n=1 Tax=Anaerovorax odorimutans TaxID=109327 RepID=A0ABT1RLN0_9FIRM|nr:CRISPR-associated protein Cas4 [Anaerovorax odorimutans]MCQ4636089.1 CRISPR-associated protein Cas4 [Anaerovorax odorimutans]
MDDDIRITGVMVYYYFVCKRKLWYFKHEIQMEQGNEAVKIGKLLDETSYGRENKHINIDQTINIDFIRESNVLHEVKKSKKIEEASVWQVKYYLYYLKKKGMDCVTGKIDYPLLKKSVTVELQDEDVLKMEEVLSDIKQIIGQSLPDEARRKNICKSCAYFDLCFI